jgi:hypothetical protein
LQANPKTTRTTAESKDTGTGMNYALKKNVRGCLQDRPGHRATVKRRGANQGVNAWGNTVGAAVRQNGLKKGTLF